MIHINANIMFLKIAKYIGIPNTKVSLYCVLSVLYFSV